MNQVNGSTNKETKLTAYHMFQCLHYIDLNIHDCLKKQNATNAQHKLEGYASRIYVQMKKKHVYGIVNKEGKEIMMKPVQGNFLELYNYIFARS